MFWSDSHHKVILFAFNFLFVFLDPADQAAALEFLKQANDNAYVNFYCFF